MAVRGLRILGVAKATNRLSKLPESQHSFEFEFVGLIGFVDPVRSTVPDSIKEAYRAGVRVIMITGDYPGTAVYVAKEIGLSNPENYLTGDELSKMTEAELQEKIKTINIFARVVPEQKLIIVNSLKRNHEIVAMTGDGVNDAPALKAAHIGIAMGERGTDVAREAASLVLLNDDFSSIVTAVKLGRRIFTNLKKAMGYIFSVHLPIAGMSLLPILLNLPPILLPAHIAFLELIIDPACSTVFESEPEEADIMRRPPRSLKEKMFDKKVISASLFQGGLVLLLISILFFVSLALGKTESETRVLVFSTLVVLNIVLITTNLTLKGSLLHTVLSHNKPFRIVTVGALLALTLVVYLPASRDIFHLSPLTLVDIGLIMGSAIVASGSFKLLKNYQTRTVL
jgi:Ca2+-transporting ATPase